ncbi:hypothetical protein [Acetobacter oeni]|nr:hypothetical protein [Acetobacter oeni]
MAASFLLALLPGYFPVLFFLRCQHGRFLSRLRGRIVTVRGGQGGVRR